MIAAMLVIMSVSVPVQAKTITQPNRIITLYSGNARTYTSPLGSSVSANINIIGSTSKYSKVTNITTSNKSVVTVSCELLGNKLPEHLKSGGIPPFFRVRP